jgi:Secretion system C-terminal sorting domain
MIKILLRLFLFSFLFIISIYAQPDTMWVKSFGFDFEDFGYGVQQTTDGGFIVVGSSQIFSSGPSFIWLIKTNSSGDTLWTKLIETTFSSIGYSIKQTADGGYIIVGQNDVLSLIKTDALGDVTWIQSYGFVSGVDSGRDVQEILGGYIVTGYTRSFGANTNEDLWLLRMDGNGDTLWTKTYGGEANDRGYSVKQTSDGGFIITGSLNTDSFDDLWIVKTDSNGDTTWTRTYNTTFTSTGRSIQQTTDGGYIIAGSNSFIFSMGKAILLKINSSGDTEWVKEFDGSTDNGANSVQQTTDGGFIFTGFFREFPGAGNEDIWLVKTDSNGDTTWTQRITGFTYDRGTSVQQISDGGYIVSGYGRLPAAFIEDILLARFEPEKPTSVDDNELTNLSTYDLEQNFPNPFNPSTKIKFSIPFVEMGYAPSVQLIVYDVLGNEISTLVNEEKSAGSYEVDFNASELTSGIYFYQLKAGNFVQTKKMILLK